MPVTFAKLFFIVLISVHAVVCVRAKDLCGGGSPGELCGEEGGRPECKEGKEGIHHGSLSKLLSSYLWGFSSECRQEEGRLLIGWSN